MTWRISGSKLFSKLDYNIPRACLLNRPPVPAMDLKSNRSGLWRHMLETCRRLRRLCCESSDNVAWHKTPVSQHFCHTTKIFCRATRAWCHIYRHNNFLVCDTFHQTLTKRPDRFENKNVKLYRTSVSWKIDFTKYPIVINLPRHKNSNILSTKWFVYASRIRKN